MNNLKNEKLLAAKLTDHNKHCVNQDLHGLQIKEKFYHLAIELTKSRRAENPIQNTSSLPLSQNHNIDARSMENLFDDQTAIKEFNAFIKTLDDEDFKNKIVENKDVNITVKQVQQMNFVVKFTAITGCAIWSLFLYNLLTSQDSFEGKRVAELSVAALLSLVYLCFICAGIGSLAVFSYNVFDSIYSSAKHCLGYSKQKID